MAPAVAPSCLFKALLLRHRLTLPKVNEFWRVPGRSSSSLLDVQPIAWLDLVEACKGAVFLGLVEACKGAAWLPLAPAEASVFRPAVLQPVDPATGKPVTDSC